jgi:hypothetical protein
MHKETLLVGKYPEFEQQIIESYASSHKRAEELIQTNVKSISQYESEIKALKKKE